MNRFVAATIALPFLLLASSAASPASAQTDFTGQWAPLYQE